MASDDPASVILRERAGLAISQQTPRQAFPLNWHWTGKWVAAPALAFSGFLYIPHMDLLEQKVQHEELVQETRQVREGTLKLKEQLASLEQDLTKPDASIEGQQILDDLQALAEKLDTQANLDKKQALMELGELEEKYREQFERQQQFSDMTQSLSEQLDDANLNEQSREDLKDLVRDLKNQDFKGAAEKMRDLANQLRSDDLNSSEKQALAKQMKNLLKEMPSSELNDKLSDALDQMANGDQNQNGDQTAKNDQQNGEKSSNSNGQNGDGQKGDGENQSASGSQAADLADQLAKDMADMDAMQKMKDGLESAKDSMLGDGQNQFDKKSIEDYMNQQAQLGGQCPGCGDSTCPGGEGCPGNGQGQGQGQGGMGKGPGTGGKGQGQGGIVPEEATATNTKSELDSGQLGRGKILRHMFVQGTAEAGDAPNEYYDAVRSARQEAADSLANNRVPREYEDTVKNYFDTMGKQK